MRRRVARLLALSLVVLGLVAGPRLVRAQAASAESSAPSAASPAPEPTPSPAPSPVPSPAQAPPASSPPAVASAHAAAPSAGRAATESVVRLKDRKVFTLAVDAQGKTAGERARAASRALEAAFDAHESDAHWAFRDAVAIVYLGATPIVELTEDDAHAAGAVTLEAHAGDVAAKIRAAITNESKRSAMANTVFSVSLVVFSALIAFLLLGKASELGTRGRTWVDENPDRIPPLKLGGVEVLRPAALEAFLVLGIEVAKRLVQFGVLYTWIIFALSLFESTKGYTDKLTALVVSPLSGFATRLGSGLPLAVVAAIAVLATIILVRAIGVFFAGVARGETSIDWIPQDLAGPVSVVVRIAVVVLALITAAPLLTGSDEGSLSRLGFATVFAFALAATPVLACGTVGAMIVFGRKLRVGDFVEVGGRRGRVRSLSLLEVAFEDEHGCEVRLPHLVALWQPTRVMGPTPVVSVDLVVDPRAPQLRVRDVLNEAASALSSVVRIDLASIDADGALYKVTIGVVPPLSGTLAATTRRRKSTSIPPPGASPKIITLSGLGDSRPGGASGAPTNVQLAAALADALAREGIALGRRTAGSAS